MAESDLIRGNVDTVILKVLYEGDRYGYDLIRQINARSDGQWEIKQPTVYACLKRLEKQGFVSSYWDSSESDGGRRKYYSLTESGKDVFIKYKNEFERANALFGGIISGGDSVFIQPVDDYSDVEDEGYSVPKRRSRPKRAQKTADTANTVQSEQAKPDEERPEAAEEPVMDEAVSSPASEEQSYSYIQQDLFSLAENDYIEQKTSEEQEQYVNAAPARAALDPRSIIDRYYEAETGESYSDAHGKAIYSDVAPEKQKAEQPAPAPSVPAVAKSTEPTPAASKQVAEPVRDGQRTEEKSPAPFVPYGFEDNDESPARKEYKTVLSDLVEKLEVASPDVRTQDYVSSSEQAAVAAQGAEEKRFFKVKQAGRDLGNNITVRSHNDSAKEYTHKYYYFSNKLMMTHYTIMCAAMFLIGLTLFLTFYVGMNMRMQYDYLLYTAAGLFPIALFIAAVVRYAENPDRKKRINVNFRFAVIIRCIIMLQVAVVIYCLNLIWGMPVGFSSAYVPSLVIPVAYALFIPVSEVIFYTLLRSENYAVE
ncbi:MAG: helix-turn-helix transcriptional regulator [Clostridiales bacterium]|nr:helix-turn-helix transcriptional regulator [Clostridiales bacterium]